MSEEQQGLSLSNLSPAEGSRHRRKRLGVGEGSGKGKTCGKGHKGHRARSGYKVLAGFEGGQMPLHRRLPKRGFVSRKKLLGKNLFNIIPLAKIVELGGDVTLERLQEAGLSSRNDKVKIVSGQKLESAVVIEAHAATSSVKAAVEAAGGEIKIISLHQPKAS